MLQIVQLPILVSVDSLAVQQQILTLAEGRRSLTHSKVLPQIRCLALGLVCRFRRSVNDEQEAQQLTEEQAGGRAVGERQILICNAGGSDSGVSLPARLPGGMAKDGLVRNKRGMIVSRAVTARARRNWANGESGDPKVPEAATPLCRCLPELFTMQFVIRGFC